MLDLGIFYSSPHILSPHHRNRALHNDMVAVCLLPKSEWRSRSNALPSQWDGSHRAEDTHGEVEGEKEGRGDVVPTGRVVGILERQERVYVATFDVSSNGIITESLILALLGLLDNTKIDLKQ